MADWSKDCVACKFTWDALFVLDQSKEKPSKAGAVRMDALTYWQPTDDAATRAFKARTIAIQIDNLFLLKERAKRESGVTKPQAIKEIQSTLTTADSTIADLAEVHDGLYDFWGEK